jgi:hypothetical protein
MASFVKIRLNHEKKVISQNLVYLKCQDRAFPVIQDICNKNYKCNKGHTQIYLSTTSSNAPPREGNVREERI